MGKLVINHNKISPEKADFLVNLCPFGAISYDNNKLDISSACKMCKMCVKKGEGAIDYVEEVKATVDKSLWKGICVYVDHFGDKIHKVTYELCGKARELASVTGHPVYALVIGSGLGEGINKLLHYGVDKVFVYDDIAFEDFKIEPYTAAFCDFINKVQPSSILVGATNLGRQLAPRVAARCRAGLTADCTVLEMKENTDLVQIRPAFGGNIMAQIVTPRTRPQFCTVRYKVFSAPARRDGADGEIITMPIKSKWNDVRVAVQQVIERPAESDISEADAIVAVGRGIKTADDLALAQQLADALGAQLACTRPLVENGWMDASHQIGLSGKTVKPKLIITLGISGAVQFAAGMKGADCIIAVNTDKTAPIFDVAHYCVVGDLYEVMNSMLNELKGGNTNV